MYAAALLIASLLTAASPSDDLLQQYHASASTVGRSPEANLKLALWCEAHGLEPEREKHLAMVIVADPENAVARGLLGQVREVGKWRTPSRVAERVKNDPATVATLNEYAARRAKADDNASDQWKLALWCEQNRLPAESTAHLIAVLRHEPNNAAARKRLGYKKQRNGWFTDEQISEAKSESTTQEKATRHWTSILESLRNDLRVNSKRTDAERSFAAISDPRAVPSILRVFGSKDQPRVLQLLGQIDSVASSRAVAMISVFGTSAQTRRMATETLRMRDPREYADLLITMLRDPIQYEVKPVAGPGSVGELTIAGKKFDRKRLYQAPSYVFQPATDQIIGYDAMGVPIIGRAAGYGTLSTTAGNLLPWLFDEAVAAKLRARQDQVINEFAQATGANQQRHTMELLNRVYANDLVSPTMLKIDPSAYTQVHNHPVAPMGSMNPWASFQALGMMENQRSQLNPGSILSETFANQAVIPLRQYHVAARRVESQLEYDASILDSYNEMVRTTNSKIVPVLNAATGQNLSELQKPWSDWWIDQLGYRSYQSQSQTRPTYFEQVTPGFVPQVTGFTRQVISFSRMSCFGAGTLVKTLDGSRPIESIAVGDRVLSQDPETGVLSYQPVLVVHHNPPSTTLKVMVGDEPIVASTFHRFWVAGHGWKMARDLKTGDAIRMLDGRESVVAVETGKVQPVFNLDVAGGHTFFVGQHGALVHDNSVPGTRDAVFDAIEEPETLASAGKE